MYLNWIAVNTLFLVIQTNGHAWLHHIPPKSTDLHHRHVFPTHKVSLVPLPSPTLQKTPVCSFQFYFSAPFPPLLLNPSIHDFLPSKYRKSLVSNQLPKLEIPSKQQKCQDTEEQQIVIAQVMWLLHCISTKIIYITHTHEGVDLSWSVIRDANIYWWHRSIPTSAFITHSFNTVNRLWNAKFTELILQ